MAFYKLVISSACRIHFATQLLHLQQQGNHEIIYRQNWEQMLLTSLKKEETNTTPAAKYLVKAHRVACWPLF